MEVADWPLLDNVLRILLQSDVWLFRIQSLTASVHTSHALEVLLVSCKAVPLTKLRCGQSPCSAEGCAPRNGQSSSQADLDHVNNIVAEPLRPFLALQNSPQKALEQIGHCC